MLLNFLFYVWLCFAYCYGTFKSRKESMVMLRERGCLSGTMHNAALKKLIILLELAPKSSLFLRLYCKLKYST